MAPKLSTSDFEVAARREPADICVDFPNAGHSLRDGDHSRPPSVATVTGFGCISATVLQVNVACPQSVRVFRSDFLATKLVAQNFASNVGIIPVPFLTRVHAFDRIKDAPALDFE